MVNFDLLFEELTGLDEYDRSARLYPALLVAFPVGLAVAMYTYGESAPWAMLWGLGVFCGVGVLLTHFARDAGKQKEEALFEQWGGKPTTDLLRHRNAENRTLLERRHACLEEITGESLPTEEKERDAPDEADEMYEMCVRALRTRTYDEETFPLVSVENKRYGFRRNLYGLRWIGLAASLVSLAAVLAVLFPAVRASPTLPAFVPGAVAACSGGLAVFWIGTVRPSWVRRKAEAYAERPLDACELLRSS